MEFSVSAVSLVSAFLSIAAIVLAVLILNRVYQEEYRRPWLFIGISAVFFGISELLRFLNQFLGITIFSDIVLEVILYVLAFISIAFITYGLLLEFFILKFYKGKFVKMKFIPVQEGTLAGEIDINVSPGNSYLAVKKDRYFLISQFAEGVKKGFEGFLITEDNPSDIRSKYKIEKTPIAWITQIDSSIDSSYVKKSLDENSDIVDPLQLNNLISYVDNFLEQSVNPFIMIELNILLRVNNFTIVLEFLKYLASKAERYNGIFICMINSDVIKEDQLREIRNFMRELE